jgi:hypothetical protein
MRLFRALCLPVLLFTLLTVSAASAQAPRSIPDNDMFAQARQLIPGASVKIKDPSAATVEGGEPTHPCAGVAVRDSVWFTFAPVHNGTLFLSTAGTNLVHPQQSTSLAVLTAYSGTSLGTLSKIDCSYAAATSWTTDLSFVFGAGVTYYIELSLPIDIQYAENSFYKLTSRLTSLSLLPVNYGFESPIGPDNWKLKNGTNDTAACESGTHPWIQGSCSFKFTPSPEENASLSQTVSIPSNIRLRKGGMILTYLYYYAMESPVIQNASITVTLKFGDGRPPQKIVIDLSGSTPVSFGIATGVAYLPSSSLTKLKIKVTHKSTVGALVLDNIALEYEAGASTRGSEVPLVIPMPAH